MDFTEPHPIGERYQLVPGSPGSPGSAVGYDHNYCLNKTSKDDKSVHLAGKSVSNSYLM